MPSEPRRPAARPELGATVRAWATCSRPAFVLVPMAVALELAAFGAMPEQVPRHVRFAGPPDAWWSRDSWLGFSAGMTVFFAAMILVGGVLLTISPSGFRLRDKEATRYWTREENWPLMRQRLWLLIAWLAGLFAIYLALSLGVFALAPSWGLPHWANLAVMVGGLVAGASWLFVSIRRLTTLPGRGARR